MSKTTNKKPILKYIFRPNWIEKKISKIVQKLSIYTRVNIKADNTKIVTNTRPYLNSAQEFGIDDKKEKGMPGLLSHLHGLHTFWYDVGIGPFK